METMEGQGAQVRMCVVLPCECVWVCQLPAGVCALLCGFVCEFQVPEVCLWSQAALAVSGCSCVVCVSCLVLSIGLIIDH